MKPLTRIASVIFGIVSLAHASRLLIHFQLKVGDTEVPLWINVFGFIIAGFLSFGLWKESEKSVQS
jgi:hypothetical protein